MTVVSNDGNDLYASEAELRAVLDNLTEFVVRWLPDGIRTYVNPAYCHYYEITPEEALGTSFFPHIAEEDLEGVRQRIAGLSVESPTSTDIHRVIRPDGIICWQEWTDTAIFDDDGRLVEYQSTGRDITERKQLEEELATHRMHLERLVEQRTRELQSAMDELKAFSYSVSHDLRAPLRRIDGFSKLLLEDYSGQLDDIGESHLQRIRNNIQHMNQLVEDMLLLSQASRHEIREQEVDLGAMAHDVVTQFEKSDPRHKVEFIVQKGIDATGDAHLLRILLDNLLGNAWKYTARVSSPEIRFGATTVDDHLTYFVSDNGAGFSMQDSAKLFRPFQRLHREAEFAGTGIGLATAYRVIQRHGGSIWAHAEVDKGATFYFTLGS